MIVGKQNLLTWFNALPQDFIFWSMYKQGAKDSGYHLTKSQQDENTSKQDSYDRLAQTLNILANGRYVLSVQQKPGGIVKGAAAMDFELTMADANSSQTSANIAGFAVGMVSEEKAQQIAEQKFEQMMVKRELEELKKKCKELEAENKEYEKTSGGVWEQIGGLVIPHIMQRFTPVAAAAAPAMAGIGTIESAEPINPTEMELMQQKLGYVLQKTEELFGEPAVPFLEKLINTVEANPHFVGMIKGFVK